MKLRSSAPHPALVFLRSRQLCSRGTLDIVDGRWSSCAPARVVGSRGRARLGPGRPSPLPIRRNAMLQCGHFICPHDITGGGRGVQAAGLGAG